MVLPLKASAAQPANPAWSGLVADQLLSITPAEVSGIFNIGTSTGTHFTRIIPNQDFTVSSLRVALNVAETGAGSYVLTIWEKQGSQLVLVLTSPTFTTLGGAPAFTVAGIPLGSSFVFRNGKIYYIAITTLVAGTMRLYASGGLAALNLELAISGTIAGAAIPTSPVDPATFVATGGRIFYLGAP